MEEIKSADKIIKIQVTDKDLHLPYNQVDIGFVAEKILKELLAKKGINEKQNLDFRMECKAGLQGITEKLLDKSPLQFTLTRKLACLDPRKLSISKDKSCERMKAVLDSLIQVKRVDQRDCDDVLREFREFIDEYGCTVEFKDFDPCTGRLDVLFNERMSKSKKFCKVWVVVKLLLLLSHGQATVERGFSINRQIEVENMAENTYSAQRLICDYVHSIGDICNMVIDKKMLLSVAGARQKYMQFLDEQKRIKSDKQKGEKRKSLMDDIEELKSKKKRFESEAKSLEKEADELALKAEASGKLVFVAKSNSLRRSAKEKFTHVQQLNDQLESKLQELKST